MSRRLCILVDAETPYSSQDMSSSAPATSPAVSRNGLPGHSARITFIPESGPITLGTDQSLKHRPHLGTAMVE